MTSFKFTATVFDDGQVITDLNCNAEQYPAAELVAAVTAITNQTAHALAAETDTDARTMLDIMFQRSTPKEN